MNQLDDDFKELGLCSLLIGILIGILYMQRVSFSIGLFDYIITFFSITIRGGFFVYFPCILMCDPNKEHRFLIWPLIMLLFYIIFFIFLFQGGPVWINSQMNGAGPILFFSPYAYHFSFHFHSGIHNSPLQDYSTFSQ